MKKFLLVAVVSLLLVAAGLGIFIATFNADRYRPIAVQKISEALGAPVEMGRLSLVFKNGLALRVEDLAVYTDETKKVKSLLLPDANIVVRLMPLLHKDIQVASVSLTKPAVRLVRNADGSVQLAGSKMPAPSTPAASGKNSPGGPAMLLSVSSFVMQGGRVDFKDDSPSNPFFVSVRDIDVKVKNFSLTRPFAFDAAAAVFSTKQNVHVSGSVQLPKPGDKGYIEKLLLQTGLADWDLAALAKAVPAVRSAGLEGNMGGKLEVQSDHMSFDPQDMKSLKASVKLQNGAVKLQSLKSAFEKIQLDARVSGGDLEIENFSSNFAKGTLKASGTVKQFQTRALSDLKTSFSDLAIDELMPDSAANAPHLNGHVSLDFEGQASGTSWPQISQTLSGRGNFSLKDGVLLNYNLLREVIEKISIIPGAEGALQQNLPGIYKAKLGEPSTLFQPINMPFAAQNGQVLFDRLVLVTDVLLLEGSGQVGLDKSILARMNLHIHKELSGVMVSLLPQIQVLTNTQGEIEIPMQIQGVLPQVMVLPDKEFLTQKLLGGAAQQLVTSQLRNLLDKPAAVGQSGENSVQDLFSSKGGLKSLLNKAVGQANAGSQQQ